MTTLYSYTQETTGVINSLIKKTPIPIFPETSDEFPLEGTMKTWTSRSSKSYCITIMENEKSHTYVIFNISRNSDMVKRFRITGDFSSNVDRIFLVAGRQIISSTNSENFIGESWFPICAMPYQYLSVYCQLSDKNGPKNGIIEYTSCLLPYNERKKLCSQNIIYPSGYDIIIVKGTTIGELIGDENGSNIIEVLRKQHPFDDKHSILRHSFSLTGKIKLDERQGIFNRLGQAFSNITVKSSKNCEFILRANDILIYRQFVESNVDTNIAPETTFIYAIFSEISFEFVPNDGDTSDLCCSIQRSEHIIDPSIINGAYPYFIPELNLVVFQGIYVSSDAYAEQLNITQLNIS